MNYGTWMATVLASFGIAKEVEGVVRQKNGGLPGRENWAAADAISANKPVFAVGRDGVRFHVQGVYEVGSTRHDLGL